MDVDGSYAYGKYFSMQEAGMNVDLPPAPSPPLAGWTAITETSYKDLATQIPQVTSGRKFELSQSLFYFQYLQSHRSGIHLFGWSRRTDRGGRCVDTHFRS